MTATEILLLSIGAQGCGAHLFLVDGRYVWRSNSMAFDENDDEMWRDSVSEPFDDLATAMIAWADTVLCCTPTFVEASRAGEIGSVVRGILERAPENAPAVRAGSGTAERWQGVVRGEPPK